MCVRKLLKSDALWILSGIAIRLARKMGLHRDGTHLGLSPFETEMRRRLWVHLAHMDFRTADVLGTRPSLDLSSADTKSPLNVEDEDLYPDMIELPPERNGITSITICLLRCEIMETLRTFRMQSGEARWEILYRTDVTLAKKDSVIKHIKDVLETKYMRYCEPTNPLHVFVSIMIRSSICKMTLLAHSPRHFADKSVKVPQSERDIVSANATKLLEYVNLMRSGHHGLDKYLWQIGTSYLWNTMLYLLIELRHRKTGPDVDKSWVMIGDVFSKTPQLFEKSTRAVFSALGKWTVEVWDDYVAASIAGGLPEPSTPQFIIDLRRSRAEAVESQSTTKDLVPDYGGDAYGTNKVDPQTFQGYTPGFDSFESYDFPDLSSFEMDPNEWLQWDQLLADKSGFAQM